MVRPASTGRALDVAPRVSRRGRGAPLALAWILAALSAPGAEGQTPVPASTSARRPPPSEPNPYLALLPEGAEPHWQYWRRELLERGRQRGARLREKAGPAIVQAESEASGVRGVNDRPELGETVSGFGSAPSQIPAAALSGALLGPPAVLPAAAEPDGSIPLARSLAVIQGERVSLSGRIGDGAFGSAGSGSGDYDLLSFPGTARQRIDVRVRALGATSTLDPAVLLFDSTGRGVAFGDDTIRGGFYVSSDAELSFVLPRDDIYTLAVGGQDYDFSFGLRDPFDPSSGSGVTSEGDYELLFALDLPLYADADYFVVPLRAGDVVGAVASGGRPRLSLARRSGELLVSSRNDLTALYPAPSALPGGGDAAVAYVADRDGLYAVGVSEVDPLADGDYTVELEVFRPPLGSGGEGARQVLFLDLDGATFDPPALGGAPGDPITLSPLASFLPRWGLAPEDESELVDAIVASAAENLVDDVRRMGSNGDYLRSGIPGEFVLELRNSRDHPDPGSGPMIARIVVGGSIEELGLETIGLASDIDPGNLGTAGLAVVLLDLLSGPPESPDSLNGVERAPGLDLLTLVGRALGSIAAHEAGHLFGNFHTERDSGPATLMDRGGRLLALLGAGADGVAGTADDVDVDLEADRYEPLEGLSGVENTRDVVAFGLPSGGDRGWLHVDPYELDFGAVPVGDSATLRLVLHNAGAAPLEIRAADLVSPADFARQAADPTGVLAAGASRAVDITFSPAGAGPALGTLEVRSSDPARPSTAVPLRGSGGLGVASADRARLDFGSLIYGDVEIRASATVEVRNGGAGPLALDSVLAGGTAERFTIDGGGAASVPPGGVHEIALSFRPRGAVGDARALLVIGTDDPSAPRLVVELEGRSEGPDLEISPGSPYVFGILVLSRQGRRAFRLENRGTRPLTLGAVDLEADADGQMRIVDLPSASVVPAAERESVEVVFEPRSTGIFEGLLVVHSSDPDEPRLEVRLLGGAGRPQLLVEPTSLTFVSGASGEEVTRELTLINLDSFFSLQVDPAIVGSAAFSFPTGRQVIPPESSTSLPITFTARASGIAEAELVLGTNDPLAPTTVVPLRGGSVPSVPTAAPTALGLVALLLMLAGWRALRR